MMRRGYDTLSVCRIMGLAGYFVFLATKQVKRFDKTAPQPRFRFAVNYLMNEESKKRAHFLEGQRFYCQISDYPTQK
jgi:hypothetical protein